MQKKNKFFSINTKKEEVVHKEIASHFKAKLLLSHYEKIKNLSADLARLPSEQEIFFLQSDNSFNAFTFIPLVCKSQTIRHLFVATYNITRNIIQSLKELADGGHLEQITVLISDSFITRNPGTSDILKSWAESDPKLNVLFAWTHAKVTLMETYENYYLVEGSGNWSENAFYEQYIMMNNKEVFEFRKELFTNSIIKLRYGTNR
jgi:hypothetical protein